MRPSKSRVCKRSAAVAAGRDEGERVERRRVVVSERAPQSVYVVERLVVAAADC